MNSFSPNYDLISLRIMDPPLDVCSCSNDPKPRVIVFSRPLNNWAHLPIAGSFIGLYRVLAGIADLAAGLFKLSLARGMLGLKNITFGAIQIIPTALAIGLLIGTLSVLGIASSLFLASLAHLVSLVALNILLLPLIQRLTINTDKMASSAEVSVFYDNECAIKGSKEYLSANEDHWLEELDTRGIKLHKIFV
ncbi:hypothetical protein [Criblamydia sequanensis]|uniref:Membrane protein n=1 Tax=Candidatus Criblamydia sequanensis CRIB-18 TaxID=1437425 RepID=A0A090DZ29_9BACT|nr:hypothetical protein [Criblamydia sequanensis]CDR33954.1 putative membrane protein [Criblamydia sequanensis CRIB-18]